MGYSINGSKGIATSTCIKGMLSNEQPSSAPQAPRKARTN